MSDNGVTCDVCGQNDFLLQEGFYYCTECGTQTQQLQDIHVESDDDVKYCQTTKIKTVEETPELTTWECFNYLLRGLVEELIDLGAKEELKVTTLQLWATYLRKTEVAFFDKKESKLPKLGPRYSQSDAKILYNHVARQKRKRSRSTKSVSVGSDKGSWKKKKRKLIEAEYASILQSHPSSISATISQQTFSKETTSRAIRLEFSKTARKCYKKIMPKTHLAKHEVDSNKELNCHNVGAIRLKSLPKKCQHEHLERKTIYSILYLALNLISDDIQLSDVLRFMREGHLSTSKILHLFPENIAESCERVVNSAIFKSKTNVFLESSIRARAAYICRTIFIPELKIPNMVTLTKRFVTDLCLPKETALFIERLITICPPEMNYRLSSQFTPCYEGRAMAYIIFVLKLLFGLDDVKEKAISESARKINQKLSEFQCLKKQQLFVWDEWRNYIEMRKIVLTQCHLPTSLALKQNINPSSYIDNLKSERIREEKVVGQTQTKILNIEKIFHSFLMNYKNTTTENRPPPESFKFRPSLTPNASYLENILENPPSSIYIPDSLRENHSERNIESFLKPWKLKDFFKEHLIQMNVKRLDCNRKRNIVNIFRDFSDLERRKYFQHERVRKPDFDIGEEEWLEEIWRDERAININTIAKQTVSTKPSKPVSLKDKLLQILATNKLNKEKEANKNSARANKNSARANKNSARANKSIADDNTDLLSLNSFDVFSEMNMLPLDGNLLTEPRTHLENDDLFAELSEDDQSDVEQVFDEKMEFVISNLDCWIFMGEMAVLPDALFLEIINQLPSNFVWLLDTCSEAIGISRNHLYTELLVIENYFFYVLEPFKQFKNMLVFKKERLPRDLAERVKAYKGLW